MNDQQSMRLLCKDHVTTDSVRALASQHWFLWNRIERDDNQPLVYEWSTAAKDCRIRYTDDHRLGLRWFDLHGPRCADVGAFIRSAVPIHDRSEIIALASRVNDENEGMRMRFRTQTREEDR